MFRLLSDEDFPGDVINGLLQRIPGLDLVRVQDVSLMQTPNPVILQWAADQDRIILSRDRKTLSVHAWDRVCQGLPMPGVLLLRRHVTVARAIAELEVLILTSTHQEWANQVVYLPM